jgi:hypothetical protein
MAGNCGAHRNKTNAGVSLLTGWVVASLRTIPTPQILISDFCGKCRQYLHFFPQARTTSSFKAIRRHGFVRLSPCFRGALAAVSAE